MILSDLSSYERGWLVGLLEGEGHFGLANTHQRTACASIQLGSTDRDVVERAHRLMGATAKIVERGQKRKPSHNTIFSVQVRGGRAEQIMREILPEMGQRRGARVQEVLAQLDRQRTDKE